MTILWANTHQYFFLIINVTPIIIMPHIRETNQYFYSTNPMGGFAFSLGTGYMWHFILSQKIRSKQPKSNAQSLIFNEVLNKFSSSTTFSNVYTNNLLLLQRMPINIIKTLKRNIRGKIRTNLYTSQYKFGVAEKLIHTI